jgi:cysteine desulfurase/selenocysteine lyase
MKSNKSQFPIFKKNASLVYLDSAATALKPACVIEAMDDYYTNYSANVHRGLYALSERATEEYEGARRCVAQFINANSEKEIIFTSGTTAAINLAARAWGDKFLRSGEEILLSVAEHHSNIVPWQMLAKRKNCVLKFVDVNENGELKMDDFDRLLSRRTKLIAISHVSNVLGTINPIKQIIQKAHAIGAKVLIDAAQSAPHLAIDVQALDCDFLAFSGHKLCGPTGIGVLYAKEKLLENMEPIFGGGDMIIEVFKTHSKWNAIPWKFEAGTPPIAEAIGLASAIKFLSKIGMKEIREHDNKILTLAIKTLAKIPGVKLFGPLNPEKQTAVLSFSIKGIHPHDVAAILDEENIAVRAGHHCCMPLMEHLEVPALTRASFYIYNTEKDIEALEKGIKKTIKKFTS